MWIGSFEADGVDEAKLKAPGVCAEDWGCAESEVALIGLAAGDVQILVWEDD
jgi:hypothetical protein